MMLTGTFTTSIYPAKGRPGSGSTKLDSAAQKSLRQRLRATLRGSRVIGPCRCRIIGQRAGELAKWQVLRMPAFMAHADFLKVGHFAPFSQYLPDVFIRSRLPMTPMNHEKFHGGPDVFKKSGTQTDRCCSFIYIDNINNEHKTKMNKMQSVLTVLHNK